MSAAAPAYIRSIHTSFAAAPHPSWAASINSHNQNTYQHHLHQYAAGSPVQHHPHPGRRRSASIRQPPLHYAAQRNNANAVNNSHIKFDPFADEPPILTAAAPPNNYPHTQQTSPRTLYSQPKAAFSAPSISTTTTTTTPYTIQIPAAAPAEIQRYHTPSSGGRRFASLAQPTPPLPPSSHIRPSPPLPPVGGSVSANAQASSLAPQRPPPRSLLAKHHTPTRAATPSTPMQMQMSASASPATRMTGALSGPNVSKLVAGILLNRVHAVGKPMRRRFQSTEKPREYVKSCLSSVVSIEA